MSLFYLISSAASPRWVHSRVYGRHQACIFIIKHLYSGLTFALVSMWAHFEIDYSSFLNEIFKANRQLHQSADKGCAARAAAMLTARTVQTPEQP